MPLTRDRIIGHDNERLAFRFTMLNNEVTVECQISDAAMDELAGVKGTESIAKAGAIPGVAGRGGEHRIRYLRQGTGRQRPGRPYLHQARPDRSAAQ